MSLVWLIDRRSSTEVQAELIYDVSPEQLEAAEDAWKYFRANTRVTGKQPQSDLWNWVSKRIEAAEQDTKFLGIQTLSGMQGLLQLDRTPKPSLQGKAPVLYIEYIESAPWNQAAYAGNDSRYAKVGSALLYGAIMVSRQLGCDGALALHSLPQAEGFYRSRFTDLGPDRDEENMRYFELSPEQASNLLGEVIRENS